MPFPERDELYHSMRALQETGHTGHAVLPLPALQWSPAQCEETLSSPQLALAVAYTRLVLRGAGWKVNRQEMSESKWI